MIPWRTVQTRLGVTVDGDPGPQTMTVILSRVAGHDVDRGYGLGLALNALAFGLMENRYRLASFIGQTCHESAGFTRLVENLNYSAARIAQVWPTRFPTIASAMPYAGKPAALAEKVYGGRLGNDQPGDGWRYIGRGVIQTTGKTNYRITGRDIGVDLVAGPEALEQPSVAMLAGMAFWKRASLNATADLNDWSGQTRLINGGVLGLAQRVALIKLGLEVLA